MFVSHVLQLCRHVRQKISACVDGVTSGPVMRAQTGSEDPHRHKRKFTNKANALICYYHSIQCEPFLPIPLYWQLNQSPGQVTVSWD